MEKNSSASPSARSFNVACQRCRKRKIKCDLKAPRCQNCTLAGAECIATRLSSSRAANSLPPRFIENLEAEVDRLEKEVAIIGQADNSTVEPRPDSSSADLLEERVRNTKGPSDFLKDNGFDWSIIGEAGAGTIHPRLGWGMSGMMQSAFSVDNSQPHSSTSFNPLFPLVRSSAGPRHLSHPSMASYLEVYFAEIHPALPFLDEKAIRLSMAQLSATSIGSGDLSLLLLVLSIGASALSRSNSIASYHCIELFASAYEGGAMMSGKIELPSLQFGLLSAVLSLYNPSAGSTWHLLGLCAQMAVSLGLHQARSSPSRACDAVLGEHAFWAIYVLDRIVSSSLGRPFAIDHADVSTELPVDDPDSRYLCAFSRLAMYLSQNENESEENNDPKRTLQSQLQTFLSPNTESLPPPLVLNLACQLCGWRLSHHMLTTAFSSASSVFESIITELGVLLRRLLDLNGAQPMWPLSYSILQISTLVMYGSRLSTLRSEGSMGAFDPCLVAIGDAKTTLSSMLQTFTGLDGLYRIFEGLQDGHYFEETTEVCDALKTVGNNNTREAIRCVAALARNDILG